MKKHFDYIIVGQGIAGTILSYTLIKKGKSVLVIDNNKPITSSKVAAGIFNPITGRKSVKTWLCDKLFSYLHSFYPELEYTLGTSFFNLLNIYIPLDSLEKQNSWMADSSNKKFEQYIYNISSKDQFEKEIKGGFGGMEITKSGYVLTRILLETYKKYLLNKQAFLETELDTNDINIDEDGSVTWKGITCNKLLFCEGVFSKTNRFFEGLDFRETKGETLIIKMDSKINKLINRSGWFVPLGNGIYKSGSTYEHHDLSNNPTEKGRIQLTNKLNALLKVPYTIIKQEAAVRPTTYDRKPLLECILNIRT